MGYPQLHPLWRLGPFLCEVAIAPCTIRVLLWQGSRLLLDEQVDTYERAVALSDAIRRAQEST